MPQREFKMRLRLGPRILQATESLSQQRVEKIKVNELRNPPSSTSTPTPISSGTQAIGRMQSNYAHFTFFGLSPLTGT
nr:hypothetical protein HmN_000299300 [Hymenolepis microstoma]